MRHLVIDSFDFADLAEHAGPGDDTVFVAVRSGSATGWYGPLADPVARTVRTLAPALVGTNAADHESLQDRLAQAAPRSRTGSWAVGALDCAAWDLHAQAAGCPVAGLLTDEPLQHRIAGYSSWLTRDLAHPAITDLIAEVSAQGWAFTKWGLRNRPGAGGGALADLLHAAATAEPVAVDAVGTWPQALAAEFAAAADPAALVWLEDPAPTENLRAYEQLSLLPIAVGERFTLTDDAPAVLDAIRPTALTLDVVGCGGLTAARRILARTTIPVFPHGRSLIPGLHLAAARPDRVLAVEYRQQWEPGRQTLYAHPVEPDHGHLTLPTTPGLGAAPRSAPCRTHPRALPVQGRTVPAATGPLLVLDARLEGHDTFLTGTLTLHGHDIPVRITTLDDSTTLQPTQPLPDHLPEQWSAALHLRHGQRPRDIPDDLRTAATTASRDLDALDDAELRYALTFLGEATTDAIRTERLAAIVTGLPTLEGDTE